MPYWSDDHYVSQPAPYWDQPVWDAETAGDKPEWYRRATATFRTWDRFSRLLGSGRAAEAAAVIGVAEFEIHPLVSQFMTTAERDYKLRQRLNQAVLPPSNWLPQGATGLRARDIAPRFWEAWFGGWFNSRRPPRLAGEKAETYAYIVSRTSL